MRLKNEEMQNVNGGGSITSSMLNAISKAVLAIYELGKSTGSSIRIIVSKKLCPAR